MLLSAALVLAFPGSAVAFGLLSSFGSFGSGAGQLDSPRGVTVGPEGTAYVADIENHRVSVFAADGSFVRAMGKDVRPGGGDICTTATGCKAGIASSSPQGLTVPVGVALGPEGRLFVSDANNNRVAVYDPNGTFNYFFGTTHLHQPRGIQFDSSGLLYVANWSDNRIDVFTPGGAFVRGIGKEVDPGGGNVCTEKTGCQAGPSVDHSAGSMAGPEDVAFGPASELLVADPGNDRIDVFAPDGSFLRAFGKEVNSGSGDQDVCTTECQSGASGSAAGAFAAPSGVAADAAGRIYVADRLNQQISVSRIDGSFVNAFGVASQPFGVVLDCRGAVYVSEASSGFALVERFGEPGTPTPSCVEPQGIIPITALGAKLPSNKFRFAGLVKNRSNGLAVLFVRVPGPGRVILYGRGFRRLARTARQAKRVRLPIKPKIPLKRFLKQHGKARIRVGVTFEPTGGDPRTLEKVIVLRRQRL
ncbi:MAG TPA: NHL repeat-containing protein [Solirubrobacterales bacterium]|nr:NHL repeat-containing protein [Solirubrobacterales bacterium]